ncbi:hypothetical protein KGV52_00850 [Candidatus Gracilibacteria bacterium]|nr:hypothetical protein [Candidatus Gracilibacteria bacterium]
MEKMKKVYSAIKAWDEKHTNMHSGTYMGLVAASASTASLSLQHAASNAMGMF